MFGAFVVHLCCSQPTIFQKHFFESIQLSGCRSPVIIKSIIQNALFLVFERTTWTTVLWIAHFYSVDPNTNCSSPWIICLHLTQILCLFSPVCVCVCIVYRVQFCLDVEHKLIFVFFLPYAKFFFSFRFCCGHFDMLSPHDQLNSIWEVQIESAIRKILPMYVTFNANKMKKYLVDSYDIFTYMCIVHV